MDISKVTVVLPCYEPDEKFLKTLSELEECGFTDVVVVNDGSSKDCDVFFEAAKKHKSVTYLEHPVNRGKGAALKTAYAYLAENRTKENCLGVITADSDGQHLTKDIIACAEEMTNGEPHVVFGCRDFSLPDVPERSRKGNNLTRNVFKKIFKIDVSDTQTGLRAVPYVYFTDMLDTEGERYEYENNMIIMLRDRKIPFSEVKIETVYIEENKSSHFRPVADSVRIYYHLFERFIKYMASSLSCVLVENIIQTVLHDFLNVSVSWASSGFLSTLAVEFIDFLPARFIASVLNYILNRAFVFKNSKGGAKSVARYFALWAIQAIVTALIIAGLEELFDGTNGIVYFLIISAVKTAIFFASYTVQKKWVFSDKKQEK